MNSCSACSTACSLLLANCAQFHPLAQTRRSLYDMFSLYCEEAQTPGQFRNDLRRIVNQGGLAGQCLVPDTVGTCCRSICNLRRKTCAASSTRVGGWAYFSGWLVLYRTAHRASSCKATAAVALPPVRQHCPWRLPRPPSFAPRCSQGAHQGRRHWPRD